MRLRVPLLSCLVLGLLCAVTPVFGQRGSPLSGQRVLWLGDSITQAGDYVSLVEYELDKRYPAAQFDFISIGLSSETVSCLSENDHPFPRPCVLERLQRALDLVKPGVVIACYGMNDGIYHPQSPERMAAFQQGIRSLIEAVKAKGARLVLLTPPPFDPLPVRTLQGEQAADFSYKAPFERYDDVLGDYAAWEKTLPAGDATVIDLHTPVNAYLAQKRQTMPGFSFAKDGIHPDLAGHWLMARTILAGLGVPLTQATPEAGATQAAGDRLFALVKSRREKRSAAWLEYVGYTRDKTVKKDSLGTAEDAARAMQFGIDQARRGK